jgi:hypothetical protein
VTPHSSEFSQNYPELNQELGGKKPAARRENYTAQKSVMVLEIVLIF